MSALLKMYGKKVRHGALSMLYGSNIDVYNRWTDTDGVFTEEFKVELRKLPHLKEIPDSELTWSSRKFKRALDKLIRETEKRVSKYVDITITGTEGEKYDIIYTPYKSVDKKTGENIFMSLPKTVTLTISEKISNVPEDRVYRLIDLSGSINSFECWVHGCDISIGEELKCYLFLSYNWFEE